MSETQLNLLNKMRIILKLVIIGLSIFILIKADSTCQKISIQAKAGKIAALKTCNYTNGLRYDNWYNLDDFRAVKRANEIKMKLYVIGKQDAYILLSPEKDPGSGDPAYEIMIDYRSDYNVNNYHSVSIRPQKAVYFPKSTWHTEDLLNCDKPNEINLTINKDDGIKLTVNGGKQYNASKYNNVKYVRFESNTLNPIDYYFNCD
ncbi:uncharacterized protein LOC116342127 [Contarinia nasturtii]|uniref:uncharacterized protein LOC116342127 n=1 Tax=Contarinia nasturtii TaxID=265458 RepID=UPI0012D39279|nr:uncharacterized protein LOC116342127 [Contarinia nasturtii]